MDHARRTVAVLRWGQGGTAPQILPSPHPQFLDTVVLLLVELIGSIVISLKFRLAVVASQMMRGQPPPQIFFPRNATASQFSAAFAAPPYTDHRGSSLELLHAEVPKLSTLCPNFHTLTVT